MSYVKNSMGQVCWPDGNPVNPSLIGFEVHEVGYSGVLMVIDELGESALVERLRDKERFWILKSKLRRD